MVKPRVLYIFIVQKSTEMKWKKSHSTQTTRGFIPDIRTNGRHIFQSVQVGRYDKKNVKMDDLVKLENKMASKEDL